MALGNISLLHNGFSRRSNPLPSKDLYKGNGRVKHEEHKIHVGPFLGIRILSWQSKDKHARNDINDIEAGGNNHFDIHVFRNSNVIGGPYYEQIRLNDLNTLTNFDPSRLFIEQVKEQGLIEFLDVITGNKNRHQMKSDLNSHEFAVSMMSAVYRSYAQKIQSGSGEVKIPVLPIRNMWHNE